jgi:hypothetical protein
MEHDDMHMHHSAGAKVGWFFGVLVFVGLIVVALALTSQLVAPDAPFATAALWLIVAALITTIIGTYHKIILGLAMLIMIPAFVLLFVQMKNYTTNTQPYIYAAVSGAFVLIGFIVTALLFFMWARKYHMHRTGAQKVEVRKTGSPSRRRLSEIV